ncbi:hypothetical protein B0I33_110318, partial [Prauserella shujinwangii]
MCVAPGFRVSWRRDGNVPVLPGLMDAVDGPLSVLGPGNVAFTVQCGGWVVRGSWRGSGSLVNVAPAGVV